MQELREYRDNMPLDTQLVTVVLVQKHEGIHFAITKEEKSEALKAYRISGGTLMAVWTGENCSHAFNLPVEKLEEACGERKAS